MGRLTGRPSVLIVDDSQFICKLLAKTFLDYGFRLVAIAGSCEEALAHIGTFKPDLVTLDLVLPDGNGFDLYDKLQTARPDLRILVVSDQRHQEHFETSQRLGAAGFLPKPFSEAALLQLLQKMDLGA